MWSIISALVENKPGVLFRVTNMFRARNFNIESLSVGPTEQPDLSRITVTIDEEEPVIDQLVKQLDKLVDVVEVLRLDVNNTVHRELALIKIKLKDPSHRIEIINLANIFRGKIVDISKGSIMVEITGTTDKINAFIALVKDYNIVEMARTGVTALARGVASE
ncbi:MAG: acetolactate synthase small subunit [Candidatus Nitrosocaldaceae archaeon]|nr:MAG: acetolactate synthase small subunit [Candidatus Nitrosocaldaceae archaeon]